MIFKGYSKSVYYQMLLDELDMVKPESDNGIRLVSAIYDEDVTIEMIEEVKKRLEAAKGSPPVFITGTGELNAGDEITVSGLGDEGSRRYTVVDTGNPYPEFNSKFVSELRPRVDRSGKVKLKDNDFLQRKINKGRRK